MIEWLLKNSEVENVDKKRKQKVEDKNRKGKRYNVKKDIA